MADDKIHVNLEFVKSQMETLLNLYHNKYILVYEKEVVGSFDSYEAAAEEGINNYGTEGDFLVYFVTETTPVNFVSVAMI